MPTRSPVRPVTSLLAAPASVTAVRPAYRRREAGVPEGCAEPDEIDFFISYAAPDRQWAEWIAWHIEEAGFRVLLQDWDNVPGTNWVTMMHDAARRAARTIAVLSSHYLESVYGAAEWQTAWQADPAGTARKVLPVRVADCTRPGLLAQLVSVDVFGTTDAEARRQLLAAVEATVRGRSKPTSRPLYPNEELSGTRSRPTAPRPELPNAVSWRGMTPTAGDEPRWFHAPARNNRFVERDAELQSLRGRLRAAERAMRPIVLLGPAGMGKSQLALELVHRFRAEYDLVWWIRAVSPESAETALAALGTSLRLPFEDTASGGAQTALAALRQGDPTARWLLVFDDADDVARLRDLLPVQARGGQLLITSYDSEWVGRADPVQVDVFRRSESVACLRGRTSTISQEQARRVAAALGDLPLAVDITGAWLAATKTPVAEYLQALTLGRGLNSSVRANWSVLLERLRDQSPGAYRMLQLCSVLASEIATELLYSDQLTARIATVEPFVAVGDMRGVPVQQLDQFGLLRRERSAGVVQMHRLLQAVVQDRMTTEHQATTKHEIHLVLAAFRPSSEPDDPDSWGRFQMIWPHLGPSNAVVCADGQVRQLLIDRVRYLWRRGDLARGRELGETVAQTWTDRLASAEAVPGDQRRPSPRDRPTSLRRHILHLRFTIANIYREQADFAEALRVDQEVRAAQLALLGRRDLHTLMTSGGLAADYRAVGRYREALALERVTHATLLDYFGEDHPRRLAAANNLAASLRAVGDFREASSLDAHVLDRRGTVLGPRHPYTLHSMAAYGRDLREAGEYPESIRSLDDAFTQSKAHLGLDAVGTLNAQAGLAVSMRAAGRIEEAAELLDDAYARLAARFGARNPNTLSCRLNRAATMVVMGRVATALDELGHLAELYERSVGPEHPFSLICVSTRAAALRRQGRRESARDLTEQAATGFLRTLGEAHPYRLVAVLNHLTCRHEAGNAEGVLDELAAVEARMTTVLGEEHPDTVLCRIHRAVLQRNAYPGWSDTDDRAAALDALGAKLGPTHPFIETLNAGRLVYRLLDPHDPF